MIWKEIAGKSLTLKNIETLVAGKKTRLYVFRDKRGAKFKASLRMLKAESHGFVIKIEQEEQGGLRQSFEISCSR